MIHLAMGLLILSLTCAGLAIATFVLPSVQNVNASFIIGSLGAVAASALFVGIVLRRL